VGARMSGAIAYVKITIFKTPKQGYFWWVRVNYKGFQWLLGHFFHFI
jgi:hypothetical protein